MCLRWRNRPLSPHAASIYHGQPSWSALPRGKKRSLQLGSLQAPRKCARGSNEPPDANQLSKRSSHNLAENARDFFVVTPYSLGPHGTLEPAIPKVCPLGRAGDRPCRVRIHHWRLRKTGPDWALAVVRCHEHKRTFTLYPPGYAPYQRKPLVALAPDGTAPLCEPRSRRRLEVFECTLFEAAIDGEARGPWARNCEEGPSERHWSTQRRHIRLASRLLGTSAETPPRLREHLAAVLSVEELYLRDHARADGSGYRASSEAICAVLRRIVRSAPRRRASLGLRLLVCGHLAGCWGLPFGWDPEREAFEPVPFRLPPIRAPA